MKFVDKQWILPFSISFANLTFFLCCKNMREPLFHEFFHLLIFHSSYNNVLLLYFCNLMVRYTVLTETSYFTAATLKKGGNVLIPCLPCGVTFDMFECLASHLKTCSLSHIPMYFISERAEASLAYSNIYAEWWVWKCLSWLVLVICDCLFHRIIYQWCWQSNALFTTLDGYHHRTGTIQEGTSDVNPAWEMWFISSLCES